MHIPKTEKGKLNRIESYRKVFKKEKRIHHFISDGQGNRYLIFLLYYLLDKDEDAVKYIKWYSKQFDDDSGEPIQFLCWALILKRLGKYGDARKKLAEHYQSNFYIIPKLLNRKISKFDFWHSSNYEEIDFFDYIPEEILNGLTEDELLWLAKEVDSEDFMKLKNRHIEIYKKLETTEVGPARSKLIEEAYSLVGAFFK